MRVALRTALSKSRRSGEAWTWPKFARTIRERLRDPSARQLLESAVSLRRTGTTTLPTWVRTIIMTRDLCIAKGVRVTVVRRPEERGLRRLAND